MKAAELVRCVTRPHPPGTRSFTFCGRNTLVAGWCFSDLTAVLENEGRLLPCPTCLDAVTRELSALKLHVKKELKK